MKRSQPPRRTPIRRRRTPWRSLELVALREFHAAAEARARGLCEANTPACPEGPHRGDQAHHVVPRARAPRWHGLHEPTNGLWLCSAGHAWIGGHPREATARGWLKSAPSVRRATGVE